MFERFTKSARAAVVAAQEEGRRLRTRRIEPAHLLIALADQPESPAGQVLHDAGLTADAVRAQTTGPLDAEALAALGIDLAEVRAKAEESFGEGALELPSPRGHLRFTRDAKSVLERSLRVAVARGDRELGTEHLLLALLDVDDAGVNRVLEACAVSADDLRAAVAEARERRPG